jgi:hypothetical protein
MKMKITTRTILPEEMFDLLYKVNEVSIRRRTPDTQHRLMEEWEVFCRMHATCGAWLSRCAVMWTGNTCIIRRPDDAVIREVA